MSSFLGGAMTQKDYLLFQDNIRKEKANLDSRSLKISIARLIIGLLIVGFLLGGNFTNNQLLVYSSLIWIAIFIILIVIHSKITERLSYLNAQAIVIQRYLDRYNNDWKAFDETGLDYVDNVTGVMKDLDLVGKNSLFQYFNVASTIRGKKCLLDKLTRTSFNEKGIIEEQKAVLELSNNNNFVLSLETYGRMLEKPKVNEQIIEDFVNNLGKNKVKRSWGFAKYLIPILTIITIVMFLFEFYFKLSVILVPVLIFGQLIIAIINLNSHGIIFEQVSKLSHCLNNYQNISHLIKQSTFTSPFLVELQARLEASSIAFDELKSISSAVKQRNNLLAFILLNGLLLWDINCKERYDRWVKQYASSIERWLDAIGEFEALTSLQVLLHTKDVTCFANFHGDQTTYLEFGEAYHPLMPNEQAVANSFMMNHQVCVITGSNMSGKTTFLRTIGINLVLAYAGGPVMAKSFDCSLMQIFTSMRIEDDLNGISSFYAELLRIKQIVEANRQGNLMIALIDEIFKGTNSKDRIIGAQETVKQLSTNNIFTFITTHDFELCELENEISCSNYHFNEYYQGDKIKFDYLIKYGRSQTTNAQYLLKMVGITKEV